MDDEPLVLQVLRSLLEIIGSFDIVTAPSAEAGLETLRQGRFDIVVSDIRMPGMWGPEFLEQVREKYPDTVRLLCSSEASIDTALQSVATAHQRFNKMGLDSIADAVNRAAKLGAVLPVAALRETVSRIRSLPSLPDLYLKVQSELKKADASVEKIARLIEQDVAMSAKVLHLVNSAFFGLRATVRDPRQAAALLGISILRSLVLVVHVFEEWEKVKTPGFTLGGLWEHSFRIASAARTIAAKERLGPAAQEAAYLGGMFHDIGRLLLAANDPGTLASVTGAALDQGTALAEAERAAFGASHAEAGAYLMALWGFDEAAVRACAFHHRPEADSPGVLTPSLIIHVAESLDEERHPQRPPEGRLCAETVDAAGIGGRINAWRKAIPS